VHLALGKATYESMVLVICAINAVAVSVAVKVLNWALKDLKTL
jgi:hypothetical protein